jgi:hypothetical protein
MKQAVRRDAAGAAVTYTIKVLSTHPGEDGKALRRVLFRRTEGAESIEISAETDAPNLFAHLPDFLDAAMAVQRSLGSAPRAPCTRAAEESRRLRWLTEGAEA